MLMYLKRHVKILTYQVKIKSPRYAKSDQSLVGQSLDLVPVTM